jgi:hypothetical protein
MRERMTHETDAAAPQSARAAALHCSAVVAAYTTFVLLFFSPVLLTDRLLAPGDGMIYFLPNFYAERRPWDDSLWGGYAAAGDSQLMTWYPPAALFRAFGSWHGFIVSAYVLACSAAYGYAYAVTRSRLAAAVAGLTYGMGGFLVAHAGHAALVHAAAWTPAVVWSLEMLRERRGRARGFWLAAGSAAVACSALAGHPQIFAYTLLLAAAYALARSFRAGGRRGQLSYLLLCLLAAALGTGLAAVQLLPTAELARHTPRAALGFADFTSYSLPLRQLPMLLFPYLFGGAPGTIYGRAYFGAWGSEDGGWGAGELSAYAGLLPPMLAAAGLLKTHRRDLAWLWLAVGAVALLLALGDRTPLAQLTYHLPVVNKFRVPARHLMELTLAVAVLAALGVRAVQEAHADGRLIRRVVVASASVVLACLAAVMLFAGAINEWAAESLRDGGGGRVSFAPWSNPATAVPVLVLLAGGAALLFWRARPSSKLRGALLVAVVALDLASFTWFYEWHYGAPPRAYLEAPAAAAPVREELARTGERVLPARGGTGRVAELPPNLSKLWGVPTASGYGPFIPARLARLLAMPPHGSTDSWRDPANLGPDLLATRYLLLPRAAGGTFTRDDLPGLRFAAQDFNATVGRGCDASAPTRFSIELPQPVAADTLVVVSALACSVSAADEAEVARLTLTDVDGRTAALPLRAGRDTSEWAHDCPDVRPQVRHRRARVFGSRAAVREGGARCEAHDYLARFDLPAGLKEITKIELASAGAPAALALKKLTLADARAAESAPVFPGDAHALDPARWQFVGEIDAANSGYGARARAEDVGASRVYRNSRALPRAWLVGEVLTVTEEEAFAAAATSRLPDGRPFDPRRTALVEEPFAHDARAGALSTNDDSRSAADETRGAGDEASSAGDGARGDEWRRVARVVESSDGVLEIETQAGAPSFLVTSDLFYPGWEATVDGARARVFQTDYVLRGVAVPAGRSRVRFEFRPPGLQLGAGLSAASLALVAACSFALARKARAPARAAGGEMRPTRV